MMEKEITISVGQSASFTKTITESDVYTFAGLSGDLNPAHINEEYAKGTRFGGRIAHGMLSAGLISAVIGMPGNHLYGADLEIPISGAHWGHCHRHS